MKRRKCPPTSGKRQKERKNECEGPAAGNGGEEENKILNRDISRKRRGKNGARECGRGREGQEGRPETFIERDQVGPVREIRQISSSRSFLGSHFIRTKIFCEGVTFVASAGNKTQNAFETARSLEPRQEHLARSERERQFLDATGQP